MSSPGVIKAFGDAVVRRYVRTFGTLEITLQLWDGGEARLVGEGVTSLEDTGTWECAGLVRDPACDREDAKGYAVVDTDANPTLRFAARVLTFIDSAGDAHPLAGDNGEGPADGCGLALRGDGDSRPGAVMNVVLHGSAISTERELYEALAAQLDFGDFCGWNLAALRDRLLTDVRRPLRVTWDNAEVSRSQLGPDLSERICAIFEEARTQDAGFGLAERFDYELR